MKAQLLIALNRYSQAETAYKKAISLDPKSSEIRLALFWFYIDSRQIEKLKESMFEIEDDLNIPEKLWLPLGYGTLLSK